VPRTRSREHVAFGRALRQLRDAQGLSQEQLGYKAGLHRNYIGGVERAELNPTLTSIVKLARALGMQPSELLAAAEALPRRTARN
jgi:transcriptional regulator with XRE-family HTH domain